MLPSVHVLVLPSVQVLPSLPHPELSICSTPSTGLLLGLTAEHLGAAPRPQAFFNRLLVLIERVHLTCGAHDTRKSVHCPASRRTCIAHPASGSFSHPSLLQLCTLVHVASQAKQAQQKNPLSSCCMSCGATPSKSGQKPYVFFENDRAPDSGVMTPSLSSCSASSCRLRLSSSPSPGSQL